MGKKRSYQLIPGDWVSLEMIIKELGYRVLDSNSSLSTIEDEITLKADKVISAIAGHFAGLNSSGNLIDSGYSYSDFQTKLTYDVNFKCLLAII
jgi:hypothetical protein